MTYARHDLTGDPDTIPPMPSWITSTGAETPEDVAFLSGAALAHLHLVVRHPALPQSLLRDRLAFRAAEACMTLTGRPERVPDLRDEVHFARPGDLLGPGGSTCATWRKAVRAPVSTRKPARTTAPLPRAAAALQSALEHDPRDVAAALIAADTALALAMGWRHLVPILALGLRRRELLLRDHDLVYACHAAVLTAVRTIQPLASDLARRAAQLRAIAPKLRAKGAGASVALFLSEDALSPAVALSPHIRGSTVSMSDRSARRLCDRLVALGAVRELSGRDTFRLYGL